MNNQNNLNQANEKLRKALENFYYTTTNSNDLINRANANNSAQLDNIYNANSNGQAYTLSGTSISISSSSINIGAAGTYDNTITIADGQAYTFPYGGGGTNTGVPYQNQIGQYVVANNLYVNVDNKEIQRYSFNDIESIMRLMTMWIDDPVVTNKIKKMFDEWKKLEKID